MAGEGLKDDELDAIRRRYLAASAAPWTAHVEGRDHESGDTFIMIGEAQDREADMYVSRERQPASPEDVDFIAHARQDIPTLLAEVESLRRRVHDSDL